MIGPTAEQLQNIEYNLDEYVGGCWRKIPESETSKIPYRSISAAWEVDVPAIFTLHPDLTSLVIFIDIYFPYSEPRVWAPGAIDGVCWPHIETNGLLCLSTTKYSDCSGDRVLATIQDALKLLSLDEDERTGEFQREFFSYWVKQKSHVPRSAFSLVSGNRSNREIFCRVGAKGAIIFADDEDDMERWILNSGIKFGDAVRTRLHWLNPIPTPNDYPKTGSDVFDLVGLGEIKEILNAGARLPILLGYSLDDRYAFCAIDLDSSPRKKFRKNKKLRLGEITHEKAFASKSVIPYSVDRVDAEFVCGRGFDVGAFALNGTHVCIVGCGAIGGFLAKDLVLAGVDRLTLIDNDLFSMGNISRHILGMRAVGWPKARTLKNFLIENYPHLISVEYILSRFENIGDEQLESLNKADLIISAGIDLVGDLSIDKWRAGFDEKPAWISCWLEEYAVAAHAILLLDEHRFINAFTSDGEYKRRLILEWPGAKFSELGCGNIFQPYGVMDLNSAVSMFGRLATEALMGKRNTGTVKAYMGNRNFAIDGGAKIAPEFVSSFTETEAPWPF